MYISISISIYIYIYIYMNIYIYTHTCLLLHQGFSIRDIKLLSHVIQTNNLQIYLPKLFQLS